VAGSPSFVLVSAIVLGLLLPVPWAVFTFEYIGIERLVTLRAIAILAIPLIVGLVATGIVFGLRAVDGVTLTSTQGTTGLAAIGITFLNMSQWFALLYAGGLMLVSSGLLMWTFHRYEHLDSTSGTMLGTFGTIPWLSILFGLQINSVSPLAMSATVVVGFLVGAFAAVPLISPSPFFERVPAAGNVGPETVIQELTDLVVVTDGEGRIVEINRAAVEKLGVTAGGVLGGNVEEVLHTSIADLQAIDTVELEHGDGRMLFEPTVSRLTDQHDQLIGYAVVLRDVTARLTRQQRLEVFNRLLRHNLRNDMNVINGHAELIRSHAGDDDIVDSAESILRSGQELAALSQKAREAEKILNIDDTETQETPLMPLVDDVLAAAATDSDELPSGYEIPDGIVVETAKKPLQLALTHLVENAIEYNDSEDPEVRISASFTPDEQYPLCISVADNGPGIPDQELNTVERGNETQLQHSTGIGLWIVRWVITNLGGKLEFAERDPRGTVVSLHLPAAHEA